MIRLKRIPVDSSMLSAIAYDAKNETLYAEFNNGSTYAYFEVSPDVFEEFLETIEYGYSVGSFMHANILGAYSEAKMRPGRDFVMV